MLPRDRDPDQGRRATAGDENGPREWRETSLRLPWHSASTGRGRGSERQDVEMRGSERAVNRMNHGPEYGVNLKKR